jgi:hypothetical protein
MNTGYTVRLNDGSQEWVYTADFDVLAYVTFTLNLDPLLDVQIDSTGIAVQDINGTGFTSFYYGDNVTQWASDQGFIDPVISWQHDYENSLAGLQQVQAIALRNAAGGMIDQAYYSIMLHEDSDPEATLTESQWRLYRVQLRGYIALDDAAIVSAPVPTL